MDSLLTHVLEPLWHTFLALLGIGFLIFIHELGHFVAAKRCGIRVDTFCLGFQPTLFGFHMRFFAYKYGDTEYVIGMIPFGGYVKMAGEEITEERTGADDEYASKPPWQRAIVLVAGAAMNIAFAFVAFIIAFAMGVPFTPSEVGGVKRGGPAWHAGLRAGDSIVEVDGREVTDFMETRTSLALTGLREIPLVVGRGSADGAERVELAVTPIYSRRAGMPLTGLEASQFEKRIQDVNDDTAAQDAGLETGDRILSMRVISGESELEIPASANGDQMWRLFTQYMRRHSSATVDLQVDRDGTTHTFEIEPRPRAEPPSMHLGMEEESRMIALVTPGSAAAREFKAGDEIVQLAGQDVWLVDPIAVSDLAAGRDSIEYRTAAGRTGEVPTAPFIDWLLNDIVLLNEEFRVASVTPGGAAAKLGMAAGDRLLTIDGVAADETARQFFNDPEEYLNRGGTDVRMTWLGANGWMEGTLREGRASITLELPAVVGVVLPGSGAAAAGIQPGDVLQQINDEKVTRWGDYWAEALRAHGAEEKSVQLVYERAHNAEKVQVPFQTFGLLVGVNFKTKQIILQKTGFAAVALGCDRAVLWGKRVFLTVRALARREVAMSNLSGPVGIINVTKVMIESGWGRTLFILALISLNLGIFNLFPFPILDGGHLVFLGIEKLKGSPVNEKFQYYAHLVAFMLLISLALFVTYHDLGRWRW